MAHDLGVAVYVALLRGINVGGAAKVAMPALKALFESAGFDDVRTYINSGNVVFRSSKAPSVATLEKRIASDLGVPAKVLVRSAAQLQKVVDANPFPRAVAKELYVTFLAAKPAAAKVKAAEAAVPAKDPATFAAHGQEIYLRSPTGYSDTKLNNAFFEKQLGVDATTRGWPTLLKLLELAKG